MSTIVLVGQVASAICLGLVVAHATIHTPEEVRRAVRRARWRWKKVTSRWRRSIIVLIALGAVVTSVGPVLYYGLELLERSTHGIV